MRSFICMWMGELAMKVCTRPTARALERLARAPDIVLVGARQRAYRALLDRLGDRPHGLEVAVRRGRETGLDHVDAQPLELARDAHLFLARHRGPGTLLTVAQSGIER